MRVLVACETSAAVRDAFRARGHDAWSCDLLPCEGDAQFHHQRDVRELNLTMFDLLIAHPTCTYLCNSGVCWLHKDPSRWAKLEQAADLFRFFLTAPVERIAVENPIPHKYALDLIGCKYSQIIQPWMFGHMEQKATCLWLKNLPELLPTHIVRDEMMKLPKRERERLHYLPPGPDRWKIRSRTFQGIADAMADQFGNPNAITQPNLPL